MIGTKGRLSMIAVAAVLAGGCANSGLDLSTASVTTEKTVTAQKTDPVCVSLATQINALKGDGTIERLEKAASGKSAKVAVKREALQKQAELNKANADFQTRCGPTIPKQLAVQSPPAASPPPSQAANAPAASKTNAH
jgi:hypothetical protein